MSKLSENLVLTAQAVKKSYREGPQEIAVLTNVNLALKKGERIAIIGASGSGKSTLLNLLGGLDTADTGEIKVLDHSFKNISESQRGKIRNRTLGFVYQFHHLLPEFSACENVAMPLLISGKTKREAEPIALAQLDSVGLLARASHKPAELSGGERQRVAIARALVNKPQCVLMDEPTGNLDVENAKNIMDLMMELSQKTDTSFVVVTHDTQLAKQMDKTYELVRGELESVDL